MSAPTPAAIEAAARAQFEQALGPGMWAIASEHQKNVWRAMERVALAPACAACGLGEQVAALRDTLAASERSRFQVRAELLRLAATLVG